MKETVQKIKFKGEDFIITSPGETDTPIATIEQYQKFECSYAHFYVGSGEVIRFGEQIGTAEDIEFGDRIEIEVSMESIPSGLINWAQAIREQELR